jgi:hypothetical protein
MGKIGIKALQFSVLAGKFPVPASKFPVPCRTGNRSQVAETAAQINTRTRRKPPKGAKISKIPFIFPVLSSPPGLPDLQGTKLLLLCGRFVGTEVG